MQMNVPHCRLTRTSKSRTNIDNVNVNYQANLLSVFAACYNILLLNCGGTEREEVGFDNNISR